MKSYTNEREIRVMISLFPISVLEETSFRAELSVLCGNTGMCKGYILLISILHRVNTCKILREESGMKVNTVEVLAVTRTIIVSDVW